MEGVFLHQANYQGSPDSFYKSTHFYKLWIKQQDGKFVIREQNDANKVSRREYVNFNEFINSWGMLQKDCHNIKL